MLNMPGRAMAWLVLSGLLLGLAGPVWAVDGVTLLTQPLNSCLGFPLKITKPGSYRLGSNLTVTCSKDAIVITVNDVTFDLNGFTILGSGGPGIGVSAAGRSDIVVRNGTVANMGTGGIKAGDACKVEEVRVLFNGFGIFCDDGLILNNIVEVSDGDGIEAGGVIQGNKSVLNEGAGIAAGTVVQNNVVVANGGDLVSPNGSPGIEVIGGTATGNVVSLNGGDGIRADGDGNEIEGNSVVLNNGDGIDVTTIFSTIASGSNVIGNTSDDNGGFGIRFPDTTSAFTNNVVNGNSDLPTCSVAAICGGQVCQGVSTAGANTNLCNGTLG